MDLFIIPKIFSNLWEFDLILNQKLDLIFDPILNLDLDWIFDPILNLNPDWILILDLDPIFSWIFSPSESVLKILTNSRFLDELFLQC